MNPWEQLLAVQAIDTRLDQLRHKLAGLPERDVVAAAEAALDAQAKVVADVETEKHVLAKEQKRLEDEISLIEDRKTKATDTLYSDGGNDTKQLQALQDEIAMHAKRISGLEDEELEIMEQIEPLDARLHELAAERAALEETQRAALVSLAEAEAAIDADIATAEGERVAALEGVAGDDLARYERARKANGGVAVAALEAGGSCGACHIKLSAVEYDRVKHLPADAEIECEECGRFLVRR